MKPLGPSRRFSALLRWSSGCSQLAQKGRHDASHLSQGELRASVFPRSVASHHLRSSQNQQIMRAGDDLCPAFGPLRSREPRSVPKQFLLVEAIAMFGAQ